MLGSGLCKIPNMGNAEAVESSSAGWWNDIVKEITKPNGQDTAGICGHH